MASVQIRLAKGHYVDMTIIDQMKYVFLAAFLALLGISVGDYFAKKSDSKAEADFEWVTDPNPERTGQAALFADWTRQRGAERRLVVDAGNSDIRKKLIQGVAGVAGDVMDLRSGSDFALARAAGIIRDAVPLVSDQGIDLKNTYKAALAELVDGEAVLGYPCNVFAHMMWMNLDALEAAGMEVPTSPLDIEEFERLGKQFLEAHRGRPAHDRVYFASGISHHALRRSLGGDFFNATLTASDLDSPGSVRALDLLRKWTVEDGLVPSQSQLESMATAAGGLAARVQLFWEGRFALHLDGLSSAVVRPGVGGMPKFGVTTPPCGDFVNTTLGFRAATVYAGASESDAIGSFFAFLQSPEYNYAIMASGDGLPPNPKFAAETEKYFAGADDPRLSECARQFVEAAETISIMEPVSPFVLPGVVHRIWQRAYSDVLTGQLTVREASAFATRRVNAEIARMVNDPDTAGEVRDEYHRAVADQKKIDAALAAGKPIERRWVRNPYHLKYYDHLGILGGEG